MASTIPETRIITPDELQVFTRQVGVLMSTGVELLRALEVATGQAGNPRLGAVARGIRNLMTDGREFHEALTAYPDVFSPFFVQMARQGEEEGVLGPTLLSVADYLSRDGGSRPAAAASPTAVSAPMTAGVPFPWGRLVAAPLLALSASAVGGALLWILGLTSLLPPDWVGPLAIGWTGVCLGIGGALAARMGRPAGSRRKAKAAPDAGPACSFCGRPESRVGTLHQGDGVAVCDSCVRSRVGQLKPADHPARVLDAGMTPVEETEPTTRYSLSDPPANGAPPEELGS